MKKKFLILLVAICAVKTTAQGQPNLNGGFGSYFVDGLYKFQDTLRLEKSEIFTT